MTKAAKASKATPQLQHVIGAHSSTHHILAKKLFEEGQIKDCIEFCKSLLLNNPDRWEVLNLMGIIAQRSGQTERAEELLSAATELNPDNPTLFYNLGLVLKQQARLDEAIDQLQRALSLNGDCPVTYYNVGLLMADKGLFAEAASYFQQAINNDPDYLPAYTKLAQVFIVQNRIDDAKYYYEAAISLNKKEPQPHFDHSLFLLRAAMTDEAWSEYQWRLKLPLYKSLKITSRKKHFDGKPLKKGETLLINNEVSFGHSILFARFIDSIKHKDATIIVNAQPELVRLFEQHKDVDKVIVHGKRKPKFDMHIPIQDFGELFVPNLKKIPHKVPYFKLDKDIIKPWEALIKTDKKTTTVGFFWYSKHSADLQSTAHCPLAALDTLTSRKNTRIYSLQPNNAIADGLKQDSQIHDLSEHFTDIADVAAAMTRMDLIICVDSYIAHLAGALNIPVWNLLPWQHDWLWSNAGNKTTWYPSMELFRQAELGTWEAVCEKVAEQFSAFKPKSD